MVVPFDKKITPFLRDHHTSKSNFLKSQHNLGKGADQLHRDSSGKKAADYIVADPILEQVKPRLF
jgi:hypothetical protein